MSNDTCNFETCKANVHLSKLCMKHYMQQRRYGQMWAGDKPRKKPVDPAIRFWACVAKPAPGESCECWEWTGPLNSDGYGTLSVDGKTRRAHRLMFHFTGRPLADTDVVDHICRNITCVNPDHLRVADRKLNGENLSTTSTRSKSGIRGVYWNKDRQKWQVSVGHNRRTHYVGLFDNIEEASKAARRKRLELFKYNEEDRAIA